MCMHTYTQLYTCASVHTYIYTTVLICMYTYTHQLYTHTWTDVRTQLHSWTAVRYKSSIWVTQWPGLSKPSWPWTKSSLSPFSCGPQVKEVSVLFSSWKLGSSIVLMLLDECKPKVQGKIVRVCNSHTQSFLSHHSIRSCEHVETRTEKCWHVSEVPQHLLQKTETGIQNVCSRQHYAQSHAMESLKSNDNSAGLCRAGGAWNSGAKGGREGLKDKECMLQLFIAGVLCHLLFSQQSHKVWIHLPLRHNWPHRLRSQKDGSVGRGACMQAWRPEFHPQVPRLTRWWERITPERCPLTSWDHDTYACEHT